jgi:hypothetical protein
LIWTPGKLVYIYKNSLNNRGIKHKSLRRLYARNIDGFIENRRHSFKGRNIQETRGKCHLKIRESTNVIKYSRFKKIDRFFKILSH